MKLVIGFYKGLVVNQKPYILQAVICGISVHTKAWKTLF